MSQTSDAYAELSFLTKFSIGTTDEIQTRTIEREKRNAISRRYYAKDNKEAIAAWKLDLDGILRVFNVCYITPVRRLLTFRFQTEFGIHARATVPDIRHDVANTSTRNKPKGRKGTDGQNQAVSTIRTLPVTE